VAVPNDIYPLIGDEISISIWVNAPENHAMADAWLPLFSDGNNFFVYCPTPGDAVGFQWPDDVHFKAGTTDGSTVVWGDSGPDDFIGWNHYVFTKDAVTGSMRIFHDGQLMAEELLSQAPVGNAGDLYLGSTPPATGNFWKGRIDDFRIYNRVLTSGEAVYLAGLPEIYYPLNATANIYGNDEDALEPKGQRVVNFKDFSVLALDWLEADLWPLGL
jgi:hypothetical protein